MQSTPIPHLILLVVEAVLQVVCISLPGYIFARLGMFSPEMQKFAANLNVALFTPCLSRLPPLIMILCTRGSNMHILVCKYSFHKARLAINNRKTCRAGCDSSHFHRHDTHLFPLLPVHSKGLPTGEAWD